MEKADEITSKLAENSVEVDRHIMDILHNREPKVLYEASRHLIKAGGKRLRPYLVVKSCEIVGGNKNSALPFAAAMEILHNFTLIHDDIMDNDELRRGKPTVHMKWGIPIAIAAGDLLFAKVYEVILSNRSNELNENNIIKAARLTTNATILLCEGQAFDLTFPSLSDIKEEDYISMVEGKTSALFRLCAEIGAVVGGGTDGQIKALGSFAWNAGIAFQIIDDILGITVDEEKLGKPAGSDLKIGKKTLIIINALKSAKGSQRAIIKRVLGDPNPSDKDTAKVLTILEELGSIEHAKKQADLYANKALSELDYFPDSDIKKDLQELVYYFKTRSY